ncbi:MAG: galactosyldiacylglycerol synthase [Candidatus Methylacidiphilales bacterium]
MVKPVLILTAGFGEGHNTAARNIASAVEHLGGTAHIMDPFAETYGRLNEITRRIYIGAINHAPRLWQLFYNMLDQSASATDSIRQLRGLVRVLGQQLSQIQPRAVISTYPVYNFILPEIYPPDRRPFHLSTMVTDSISINALWYKGASDRYYVPNEDTAAVFLKKGISPQQVAVSGFPVQLDFALQERRLSPPDIEHSIPRIIYVVNSGKQRAPSVVSRLLKKTDWHLTVAVGRDENLRQRINKIVEPWPGRSEVIGWTQDMPKLLMSHHLLITKAGGATIQEAIAAGCPVLINQVVPGQEEGNYELIKKNHAGTFASSPEQILERARHCFADRAAVWKTWRSNIQSMARPEASLNIARDLLAHSGDTSHS